VQELAVAGQRDKDLDLMGSTIMEPQRGWRAGACAES
jgi:hypothetical protein